MSEPKRLRCAIYTRKSSDEGLEQAFNSLDAQREAGEAYIKSQVGLGWHLIKTHYDDGGVSGGTMERPALQQLLSDINARKVDTVVVYKVDRLTRSLADFAKIVEVFDTHKVSFVSITQQFNTTTSMGRLTLNMLLSFAQFEREVTGERIRDKIAASKAKGMWMGGHVPLGYEPKERTLMINEAEAKTVREMFKLYLEHGNVRKVKHEADRLGLKTKLRPSTDGRMHGGRPLSRGHLYQMLRNPIYIGRIAHKGATYEGQHPAIIGLETWNSVQAKLAGKTSKRSPRTRNTEPSLLVGILHDEQGNRMSPTHTLKNCVRYRYYVNQAVLQNRDHDQETIVRIPAREIERLVEDQICALLRGAGGSIDEIARSISPRDHQRLRASAAKLAGRWQKMSAADRHMFVQAVVARVTLGSAEIRVVLRREALKSTLLGTGIGRNGTDADQANQSSSNPDDELVVRVRARLRRASGEVRLVLPPPHAKDLKPRPNAALIKTIVRAQDWRVRLMNDEAPSFQAIATAEGYTQRYVMRVLRLAFLAPDIVEALIEGRQPADLELDRLLKEAPVAWSDQRRAFGFERTIDRRE